MDKDKLNSSNPKQTIDAAYAALSSIQDRPAHVIVAGISVLFVELAEQTGIGVSELVSKAQRISRDGDTFFDREVKALRDYVKGELK